MDDSELSWKFEALMSNQCGDFFVVEWINSLLDKYSQMGNGTRQSLEAVEAIENFIYFIYILSS